MSLAFSSLVAIHPSDLEHGIAQIRDSSLHQSTGVVLRVHSNLWRNVADEAFVREQFQPRVNSICARAPSLDIFLMIDGHSAVESAEADLRSAWPLLLIEGASGNLVLKTVPPEKMEEIREFELSMLFEAGRARSVTCASTNHHFELPSGAHSTQFLRISDAFTEIANVDRVALWIALDLHAGLPLLPDKPCALLVDHPSMLVLAARIQRLLPVPLEIVAFPTYPSDVQARTESFELVKQVASRTAVVFVVIGVASTGRLSKFIKRWAADLAKTEVRVVVLYSLQPLDDQPTLCRLEPPDYRHFASKDECGLCKEGNHAVQIHAASYLVGYAPSTPVPLPSRYFDSQRDFLEQWGAKQGVLRVHYDDPNESSARHYAFYIDIDSLLNVPEFCTLVVDRAKEFKVEPDVIVIPDHPAARRIGSLVALGIQKPLVILDSSTIAKGREEAISEFSSAKSVLVIDDVFITGTRLSGINRFFREYGGTHIPELKHIDYWTLLATTASKKLYLQAQRGLTSNHGWSAELSHIFNFPLPDWHDTSTCPWCHERNVLRSITQAANVFDGAFVERLAILDSTADGISTEPFLISPAGYQLPALGARSVAVHEGALPIQALFSFASAIQQLRHAETNQLNADQFPAPAFLAERVFSANFTERLIWNCMMRSLKSKEFEPALKSFLISRALDSSESQRDVIRGELSVAWLTGKLGAIPESVEAKEFFSSVGVTWDALFALALVDRYPNEEPHNPGDQQSSQSEQVALGNIVSASQLFMILNFWTHCAKKNLLAWAKKIRFPRFL